MPEWKEQVTVIKVPLKTPEDVAWARELLQREARREEEALRDLERNVWEVP